MYLYLCIFVKSNKNKITITLSDSVHLPYLQDCISTVGPEPEAFISFSFQTSPEAQSVTKWSIGKQVIALTLCAMCSHTTRYSKMLKQMQK